MSFLEEAELQHWLFVAKFDDDKQHCSNDADCGEPENLGRRPAFFGTNRESVDEHAGGDGRQHEPGRVEPSGGSLGRVVGGATSEPQHAECDRRYTHRTVDEKDPSP